MLCRCRSLRGPFFIALLLTLLWQGVALAAGNIALPLVLTDNRATDGTIIVETEDWKLVFDEAFNGGMSRWYDLAFDPGQTDNLATESGGGGYGQGVLFDYDVYLGAGFNDAQEFMTTMGRNSDPGALELDIVENTALRVRIRQSGHPRLNNGQGPPGDPFPELKWIRVTTLWTIYPNGKVAIEFDAEVDPDGVIVDTGPGGSGKGVGATGCCGFEKWLNGSGGADFLAPFVWAGDTIESQAGGWGPIRIVQRPSPTQLVLEEAVPAGTGLDYVIRRDQIRLETISTHADGDPTIGNQCSDISTSRWQGGSSGDPLWSVTFDNDACRTRYRDNHPSTGYPPIADDVILAHWTRDRGAGAGLVFFEKWEGVNGGYFNDEAFTDISYTQLGKAGSRAFTPHSRHFLAQLGSSAATTLPTIKSVADMLPLGMDYRFPYLSVLVGELAQGPELTSAGFDPGTAAYRIKADCNEAVVRFRPCGLGPERGCRPYVAPVLAVEDFDADDSEVIVEISTDAGASFAPLDTALYNLSGAAAETELGPRRRLLHYLDTVPADATGAARVALRISTGSNGCPASTTTTTTTTTTTVPDEQSTAQQKCINGLNKAGAKLAKTQGKASLACIKAAGRGREPDPQACLSADAGGKVASARAKLVRARERNCTELPDFGYAGTAAISAAAVDGELALVADVFGADLNPVLLDGGQNRIAASCQAGLAKDYEKLLSTGMAAFVRCKKAGLKKGQIRSRQQLAGCFDDLLEDPRGRLAKVRAKVVRRMTRKCGFYMTTAFPGQCSDQTNTAGFGDCIGRVAACRTCQIINGADDLDRDCDLFDDAESNQSCSDTTPGP